MQEFDDFPVAKAEMLIRRPVTDVFEGFVNPAITSRFWFSKGSRRLEVGEDVTWKWEMYDFAVPVKVQALEENARILVEWPADGTPTLLEWTFMPRLDGTTFVSVTNKGFLAREPKPCSTPWMRPKGLRLFWRAPRRSLNAMWN